MRVLLGRIVVEKYATVGDVVLTVESDSGPQEDLALVDELGMLELAKDTLIRRRMGETGDDD